MVSKYCTPIPTTGSVMDLELNIDSTNPKDLLGLKKVPMSLIPATSMIYEAMAFVDGAAKYGPYNWRANAVKASIYVDAAMRHLQSWYNGEELTRDSKIHHLACAKASLGIIIDAMETGNLVDDRPKSADVAGLLERLEADVKRLSEKK